MTVVGGPCLSPPKPPREGRSQETKRPPTASTTALWPALQDSPGTPLSWAFPLRCPSLHLQPRPLYTQEVASSSLTTCSAFTPWLGPEGPTRGHRGSTPLGINSWAGNRGGPHLACSGDSGHPQGRDRDTLMTQHVAGGSGTDGLTAGSETDGPDAPCQPARRV